MKLSEAWGYIEKERKTTSITSANVYSILTDLGVFRETPKIKFAMKSALSYGLYDLVYGSATDLDISELKFKIANEGFSDETIMEIINSFYCSPSNSTPLVETAAEESYSEDENNIEEIRFLGQRIERFTCTASAFNENEFNRKLYILPSPLLNSIHICNLNLSYKTRQEYKGHDCDFGWNMDKPSLGIEYNISSHNSKINHPFYISAILVDYNNRIRHRISVTEVDPSEKYMTRRGIEVFENHPEEKGIDEIKYVLLYAEIGYFTNMGYSFRNMDLYKRFHGKIIVDTNEIPSSNIKISNIEIWGHKESCYIAFKLKHLKLWSLLYTDFIFWDENNNIISKSEDEFGQDYEETDGIFVTFELLDCNFDDIYKITIDCHE